MKIMIKKEDDDEEDKENLANFKWSIVVIVNYSIDYYYNYYVLHITYVYIYIHTYTYIYGVCPLIQTKCWSEIMKQYLETNAK